MKLKQLYLQLAFFLFRTKQILECQHKMEINSLLIRGLQQGQWVWDDKTNTLKFEESNPKKEKQKGHIARKVDCISGLAATALKSKLEFQTVVEDEKIFNYYKNSQRKAAYKNNPYVTVDDIKEVVLILCVQPFSKSMLKMFNLPKVNFIMRACIVYMEYFLQNLELVHKTQNLIETKPRNTKPMYQQIMEDLEELRVLIGRFYAELIFGDFSLGATLDSQTAARLDQNRANETLFFEYLFDIVTQVVWIALERKYFDVIKTEIGRVFRTFSFNAKNETDNHNLWNSTKHDRRRVMVGNRVRYCREKLKTNSPVIENFLTSEQKLLTLIGREDLKFCKSNRLQFFTECIFTPESSLGSSKCSMGILGKYKRLYDPLLFPKKKQDLRLLVTGSVLDVSAVRTGLRIEATKIIEGEASDVSNTLPEIPL